MKIFDCSNSTARPKHRGGGGPLMNETVKYLHDYGNQFGCEWVNSIALADLIFTNDVFTEEALKCGKKLIKRMDGIFWQKEFENRNILYNRAAQQADHVIFVSDYSRKCYEASNSPLNCSVIINWANPNLYYPYPEKKFSKFTVAAIATNWNREEKNFKAILEFAHTYKEININLIGTCDIPCDYPNIIMYQYISNSNEINRILNQSDAFINFSINDACPKVVSQALCAGLPVFYLDSGGVKEMVGDCGVGIESMNEIFEFDNFFLIYDTLFYITSSLDNEIEFHKMLKSYFDVFRSIGE